MQESRRKDIRRTAAVVREKCKVSRYGIIDLFKECARLGYSLYDIHSGKTLILDLL